MSDKQDCLSDSDNRNQYYSGQLRLPFLNQTSKLVLLPHRKLTDIIVTLPAQYLYTKQP